ncbi:MAG: magnesium chelatase subunit [Chloroflexota bacterium]|jgi:magnesium chelatase subunit I|nr:magnesium chelatase subunit [Chloroflexota bacterium]
MKRPTTIGELRKAEYEVPDIKTEMRRNLIRMVREGQDLFPGIVGYEESVIPSVENAIISGQDIVFLGERGQAKSRLIRALVNLLDEFVPVIAGCQINDDPYHPSCRECREKVAERGDDVEIAWWHRDDRYAEKLATPDTSIADLIGEVDPIKVAEGRYLSDELTIHYGLVPRTNRGVFCINELPDLAERIQVGLLNVMEERDVQIRGYRIRLPLDVFVVASANPEDYTNRGRIITPLKDRFGAQVRTHYPPTVAHEVDIVRAEARPIEDSGTTMRIPAYMEEIVAEITHLARRHPQVNQGSGVSVRVSIANQENIASNALRRAIRNGEPEAVPRVSDLASIGPSTLGKIELESYEDADDEALLEKLTRSAISNVFRRHLDAGDFAEMVERFDSGHSFEVSDRLPSADYVAEADEFPEVAAAVHRLKLKPSPAMTASVFEFALEGLHLGKRLNKSRVGAGAVYGG